MKRNVFQKRLRAVITMAALLLLSAGAASVLYAHGDHDAPAAPTGVASPRFAAVSDLFEVVGIKNDKELRVYVDRFATNEPVLNAKLTVEVDGKTLSAPFQPAEGSYVLPAEGFAKPGSYALVINVEAGEEIDILAANFVVSAASSTPHTHVDRSVVIVALSAGALAAVFIVVLLLRRRANRSWGVRHA